MTTKYNPFSGSTYTTEVDFIDYPVQVVLMQDAGEATIAISPGTGIVTVEFSCSHKSRVESGDAMWIPATGFGTGGQVTAESVIDTIPSTITAIRLSSTDANARVEVAQ